jgi:putative FmdB family regulatory protein
MPIYEYQCDQCGESFSHLWRSIQQAELAAQAGEMPACPQCGGRNTRRLVSQVAVLGELGGLTPSEQASAKAEAERLASITPKEQIQKLQAKKRSKKK